MDRILRPTGVPFMDGEHALLLELFQRLAVSLLSGGGVEAFASDFQELLEYAADHFAHEEEVMRQYHYPAYLQHRQAHAKLLTSGTDLLHTVRERFEEYDCYALLLFIRHWLTSHIRNHDEPLATFLVERAADPTGQMTSVMQPSSIVALHA